MADIISSSFAFLGSINNPELGEALFSGDLLSGKYENNDSLRQYVVIQ